MKILGSTQVQLFLSENIGNSFGFVYRITNNQMVDSTSVENISCKRENLRVENVELPQSPIGKSITDLVPNSRQMLKSMVN
ncbi:MAG: hypothetical protein CM15mV59_0180 [Caudoviricetes sp.]|nr:MAG: hypothetical protein CM15mV59_0180 [Caudoviricetes sp.]